VTLPPPKPPKVKWKDCEIKTPTFSLTPIEKPDMSPFLIHMTGKDAIIDILKGENSTSNIEDGCGYLKAGIPESVQGNYKAKVVCFTESPTFALDFFRYRSFKRWDADQRFGLGFTKTTLVDQGVRPVIYADNQLVSNILCLNQEILEGEEELSEKESVNKHLIQMIKNVYPLLFPLLEQETRQGYMWEREWRYPNSDGFTFRHRDVKIICCPEEEEEEIRQGLGNVAEDVEFIRAWREYDDVTNYLRRQKQIWSGSSDALNQASTDVQREESLEGLIQQYTIVLNSLTSYQELILMRSAEVNIEQERTKIEKQLESLKDQLKTLKNGKEKRKRR
jgi:hypothetical protein